ncbi:MAG TPA: molybdopterin cofactor-binding domain-containing protein [Burkholderiales bacterium]|nr:molybdopterin cofactor-binding domain-containing protein [Burkholderiales bacterium]
MKVKAEGGRRKAEVSIHDPRSTTHAVPPNEARRRFMVGAAGLTFGIALGAPALLKSGKAAAQSAKAVKMNAWVTLHTDGTVEIMSPACEMGQGSLTSLPRIVAEEMHAEWPKVKIVAAPPNDKLYGNPAFRYLQYTAGSASVTGYFTNLRQFGAQVRYVLVDNAARHWGVPLAELDTVPGAVVHAGSGRRLSYGEIAAFATVPAQAPQIELEPVSSARFRLVGVDTQRVDVPSKVNGTAQYSIDVQVPGMIYGTILREPMEGAAPQKIDDAAARAIEGVIKTVPLKYGVGVLADTPWAAMKGKGALKVQWSSNATGAGYSSGKGFELFEKVGKDAGKKGVAWESKGNAPDAIAKAATVFEGEYRADYAYHAQMEPLNSVAAVAPAGDAVEIWCGTQSQTIAVTAVAQALGIPENRVKFNGMLLGGGFGRRGNRDVEFIVDSVLMSKAAGRPVKVMWTREDDVHAGRFRPLYVNRIKAGLDANGKIVAWHHRVVSDEVLAFMDKVRYKTAQGRDNIAMRGTELPTYGISNRLAEGLQQVTGMRTAPLRGIGVGQNSFANEVFMDELAAKLKMDPVEFRLKQLADTPLARRAKHVIEEAAKMADWGRKRPDRGLGIAYLDYSGTQLAGVAEVSVDRSSGAIKVHDLWVTIDVGVPVHPDNVIAQTQSSIVYGLGLALSERITIADGKVEQSNFYDYRVMRQGDLPGIHIKLIPTKNHPTGAGQMATPLIPSAISNAVFALTGARLRQQPMLSERVKVALAQHDGRVV